MLTKSQSNEAFSERRCAGLQSSLPKHKYLSQDRESQLTNNFLQDLAGCSLQNHKQVTYTHPAVPADSMADKF